MVAAVGFLFILAGGILILTTVTGTTGQVLGAVFSSGTPAATGTASTTSTTTPHSTVGV